VIEILPQDLRNRVAGFFPGDHGWTLSDDGAACQPRLCGKC
jgi:hypothetical protein